MVDPAVVAAATKIDTGSIVRMLTLRYDPLKKPVRQPLTAKDFAPHKIGDVEGRIVEIIESDLLARHKKLGFSRASLSLSAGVDSGMTLVMLRKFLPDVKLDCVSVGFGDPDDEIERAKEIARTYDCDFHMLILDDVLRDLPKLIGIVKEPRWNLYHYYALEEGGRYSKVFYAGDGGDELFGGYTFRYSKFLSLVKGQGSNGSWRDKAEHYLACHERDWVPDQENLFGKRAGFSWNDIYRLLRPYFDNDLSLLDQVFLADFNGKLLHDWLPTNKAFEKALDAKIESIFLTEQMVRFATHVPWQAKYDPASAIGKIPLRAILARQEGFKDIKPIKKGFSLDLASMWARGTGRLVLDYVNSDSEVVKAGLISASWVEKSAAKLREAPDPRYINKMLSILALEVWYRLFASHTMNAGQKL